MSGSPDDETPSVDAAYELSSPDDNRRLYADWADTYDSTYVDVTGYRFPEVAAKAYVAEAGMWPAVDIGCGTGLVADHLPKSAVIDGLDISPEMLAVARAKGRYRALVEADLTKPLTAIGDGEYQGLISSGTFTHGHVGPEVLGELLRILRRGALVTLTANSTYMAKTDFRGALDALVNSAKISVPTFAVERIYTPGGTPPAGHEDETGELISFTRL